LVRGTGCTPDGDRTVESQPTARSDVTQAISHSESFDKLRMNSARKLSFNSVIPECLYWESIPLIRYPAPPQIPPCPPFSKGG